MTLQRGDSVVVPKAVSTGRVVDIDGDKHHVILDFLDERLELGPGEVFKLRWRYRNMYGRFLLVVTAKLSPIRRNRHLWLEYHVVRDNGSVSGVVNRIHRVNGVTRKR